MKARTEQMTKEKTIKRLDELKEKLKRNIYVIATLKDGTKKRITLLEAINSLTEDEKCFTDVNIVGDTTNQGILPELVKYLVKTN